MCNLCIGFSSSGIIEGDKPLFEGHVAFRFGDHTSQDKGIQWVVLLEGVDVTHHCTEAVADPNGAVIIIKDLNSRSKDNYILVTGNVEVRTEEWRETNDNYPQQ